MRDYNEGQKVCVSVKSLYEMDGEMAYGFILPDFDQEGKMEYFDLYNDDGEFACMDGEECTISQVGQELITLSNVYGEGTIYFTVTRLEADNAIFGQN